MKQAGADVDRQREDGGIEGEGHDAVHQSEATHGARDGRDIAGLGRTADDEGVVEEIPIVRRAVAGKVQAARTVVVGLVVDVGVVEREDHVGERPGQRDG